MANKKDNDFTPVVALPPGETIKENMIFLGMTQKELATRLDVTEKHLSNILNGNAPITYDTALKLEVTIGPSAEFWMNLETNYQLNKARIGKEKDFKEDLEILKDIPYKLMSDYGWIDEENDRKKRVTNLREFFGVTKVSSIQQAYEVAFRQQKVINEISDFGVLAWLRKAEIEGRKVDVAEYNKSKLRKSIPRFRMLTTKQPEEFYPEMKELCTDIGIALVLVNYIPKTYICGATIWRNKKVILALSLRGKRADVFWFTFFHEIAHLLNHSKKEFHISYDRDRDEIEADILASNYLIPENAYRTFINNHPSFRREDIEKYALEIGVAPFILIGRLQHDRLINYNDYNDMIPTLDIVMQ